MTMKTWGIFLIILVMTIAGMGQVGYAASLDESEGTSDSDFRGLWVATVLNLDYPSSATTDADTLKQEAIEILDQAEAMGMNAVILQVRPTADAFYKSDIFPWSKYLTGEQGKAPEDGFDPLAFWVSEAHKRGLELHAWVNPYRITRKTVSEPDYYYASLSKDHPALLHPEWVVEHSDGNLYFNPGIPEVRQLIIDGIMEIVNGYDVDGIHLDDYFYPDSAFEDEATYKKYGVGFSSIDNWRRNNVDLLIEDLNTVIHEARPEVSFGISPFGIWANEKDNALGSKTFGLQSYYSHYADTRKWVKLGWIDYIAPQIYWQIGYAVADYQVLLEWWNAVVEGTDVDLYIGHAAYRAQNTDASNVWYGTDEIARQLAANEAASNVDGSLFFRYGTIKANGPLTQYLSAYYAIKDGEPVQDQLVVGRPLNDVKTTASSYFIGGASDSRYPLYMNGTEISNRTANGYFGVYVTLDYGVNQFIFMQNGKSVVREITRSAVPVAQKMTLASLVDGSATPTSPWLGAPGETITLSCKAPAGAIVTATVGGKTITLSTASTAGGLYPATFTGVYTLPTFSGTPRMVNLGAPVYRMSYLGVTDTLTAPYGIRVVLDGTKRVATVAGAFVNSYETPTTSRGGHYILTEGMKGYVTGEQGDFTRLDSGFWVRTADLAFSDGTTVKNTLKTVVYEASDTSDDVITFSGSDLPVAAASFDGEIVSVTLWNTYGAKNVVGLSQNALTASATYSASDDSITYSFELANPDAFGGYYLQTEDGKVRLILRHQFVANDGSLPLQGMTVLLDPGHGGNDTGAIGLLGTLYPEKKVNLALALKLKSRLEAYGANVLMTRSEDVFVSLADRLLYSYQVMPDLFISIHADSLDETANLSNIRGFSVFYKDELAASFADALRAGVVGTLGRTDRGAKTANYYVIRGTWTPSVLMESGFMPNPEEFDWMSGTIGQNLLTDTWAETILDAMMPEAEVQQ
ncbi:MAG: hypothetical protein PWQ12_1797 [Clostridiales bacterium]|nr:hypothetical protein [Clostridiales bacterium]